MCDKRINNINTFQMLILDNYSIYEKYISYFIKDLFIKFEIYLDKDRKAQQ